MTCLGAKPETTTACTKTSACLTTSEDAANPTPAAPPAHAENDGGYFWIWVFIIALIILLVLIGASAVLYFVFVYTPQKAGLSPVPPFGTLFGWVAKLTGKSDKEDIGDHSEMAANPMNGDEPDDVEESKDME